MPHIVRTSFPKNTCGGVLLYPASSLKEKTTTQVFSDEFYEILKTPFLQNTSKQLLLFYGKILKQQNSRETSEKRGKMETACKQKATHAKQKLHYYLHQFFISFYYYYSKISLFLFSQLPMIYWKHEFLDAMQSYWGFIDCRKMSLTFRLKKILFSFYDCNSDI